MALLENGLFLSITHGFRRGKIRHNILNALSEEGYDPLKVIVTLHFLSVYKLTIYH